MTFDPELMKSVRRVPDVHGVVCGNEMARNSEKRLTGLNRFLEAKESRESRRVPDVHGVVCGNEMARNSEKRLTGLNRFLEAKESRESLINSAVYTVY